MFHELEGLPRRVIIDTNVLLNASFLRDGLATQAISLLKEGGYIVLIDEQSWQEATRLLRRLAITSPLVFDPIAYLEAFLKEAGIISIPQSPTVHVPGVNRSDRHLARAAKNRDAWVLTDDAPLVAELTKVDIEARSTWDPHFEALGGKDPPLDYVFRLGKLSREQGYVFARATAGEWGASTSLQGQHIAGQYTICEIENIGWLYYESGSGQWKFEMRTGDTVAVSADVARQETWTVCATYKLPNKGGHSGRIVLRAAAGPERSLAQSSTTRERLPPSTGTGKITFGHTNSVGHHWNGHIGALVTGHSFMSGKTWKGVISTSAGAPNPFTSDVLRHALLAATVERSGALILARQRDLM